ncbi:MAG: hypothetical protein QOD74_524 [Variibacter sp.]|jgi:hypothetical protein|nr:hypothetical protein [Variibacter sp.]
MAVTEQIVRKRYKNDRSGVRFYADGPGFIDIWFKDGRGYRYERHKPGAHHVAAMRHLAQVGKGLATYINQHVRLNYARKL